MKYNFLLRELLNKKIKLDFNNLKHYHIVVFDGISLNDLKFILDGYNYLVIENRYYRVKKINFSLQIIFYFIINFLLLIRRKNISIPLIYYYTVLKIIKPKIVITSIHNSLQFHQLALLLDNQINFMAVQNAHWNDIEINSYKEKNKIEKDKYNSQIFIPNFFCFGDYEEDLAKNFDLRIKNFFKYGSIRTANYIRYIKDNNIKLVDNLYDVCLISEPLFNFNKRLKKNFVEEGIGLLTKYTIRFVKENNLKFVFAIKYGKFNVGWISFSRDDQGLECLSKWYQDCIDWCFQKVEPNRYADQKYLDKWPINYKNLKIIKHKGANLAPWNIANYNITKTNNSIYIDQDKLIFFHFANIKQISAFTFKTNLSRVLVRTSGIIRDDIYTPYLRSLSEILKKLNLKILSKNDINHKSFFINILVKLYRGVRDLIYNDIIELENE